MALIHCPACGKEVSSTASACPHCGHPMNSQNTSSSSNDGGSSFLGGVIGTIILCFLGILLFAFF